MTLDHSLTVALGILWWLVSKIAFGALLFPGILIISAVDMSLHLRLSTDQLWIAAVLINLGLCAVWYRLFYSSTVLLAARTQLFVGLQLVLASLVFHFGLHLSFIQHTFQRFSLFNFGM